MNLPNENWKEHPSAVMDYGYANGWSDTPQVIKDCDELSRANPKHAKRRYSVDEGRCVTRHGCHACRYTYLVDSSD